jgi:hypothetical protein
VRPFYRRQRDQQQQLRRQEVPVQVGNFYRDDRPTRLTVDGSIERVLERALLVFQDHPGSGQSEVDVVQTAPHRSGHQKSEGCVGASAVRAVGPVADRGEDTYLFACLRFCAC